MFLTEAWFIESDESVVMGECTPPEYTFLNHPLEHLIVKDCYSHQVFCEFSLILIPRRNLQLLCMSHWLPSRKYTVLHGLPSPPSKINGLKASTFVEEFDDYMEEVALFPLKLVTCVTLTCISISPWNITLGVCSQLLQPVHSINMSTTQHIVNLVIAKLDDNVSNNGIMCDIFFTVNTLFKGSQLGDFSP